MNRNKHSTGWKGSIGEFGSEYFHETTNFKITKKRKQLNSKSDDYILIRLSDGKEWYFRHMWKAKETHRAWKNQGICEPRRDNNGKN